ncbi:MAG: right-handed parallel beta-helix repeat-containing protein, partial [Longimicrobiales bacterium]
MERNSRLLQILERLVVSALATAAISASALAQEVRRVDAERPGRDVGDGLSWATAYKSLDDALAEAWAIPGEVQIWLAEGVYVPSVAPSAFGGGTQRDNTFWIPDRTGIFGGFRGGIVDEQSLDDRGRYPWRTILSGNLGDTQVVGDNTFHVAVAGNPQPGGAPTVDQTLDTLVIQNGHNDSSSVPADFSREGAGLYAIRASNLTITNCVFRNNFARRGGAIHMFGGDLAMSYCVFEDNWGRQEGGALRLSGNSSMSRIQNCLFRHNASNGWDPAQSNPPGFGGAVFAMEMANTAQFVNCVFYDNFSAWGGAVYTGAGDPFSTVETEWINCTFA